MEAFVTTGLVLKETRYKESDRILTVLTPELGVISASAQSSLRLKSKLFSAAGCSAIQSLRWCRAATCIPCGKPK